MDKSRALVMAVAMLFLGYVGYSKISIPLDVQVITPESFYRGSSDFDNIPAREYYQTLYGITYTDSLEYRCETEVKDYNNLVFIDSNTNTYMFSPITEADAKSKGGWESVIGAEGEGCFKQGDTIINPVVTGFNGISFLNWNCENSRLDKTTATKNIEVVVNERILLVFEDVQCWWCHAHNPNNSEKHTEAVGYSSSVKESSCLSVPVGSILGVAKDTTKAKLYYLPDSFYDNGNKSIFDVTKISDLEQIHLGDWLVNREISKI